MSELTGSSDSENELVVQKNSERNIAEGRLTKITLPKKKSNPIQVKIMNLNYKFL